MITPYNILHHELVGLTIEVIKSTHTGYTCKGTLVDETSRTLTVRTGNRELILPKDCVTLRVRLPDKTIVQVGGKLLLGRPEDRIKKKYRIGF